MKTGVRILAVASGPIAKGGDTLLVGVIGRNNIVEAVLSRRVKVDGRDSTAKITSMVRKSRFGEQVRVVAINGIAVAGLNVIDVRGLEKATGKKVLIITRKRPHPGQLIDALVKNGNTAGIGTGRQVWLVKEYAKNPPKRLLGFYVHTSMDDPDVKHLSRSAFGMLRLAHLIARGVSTGESKGRI
jgi:endonuclease V-like protein UPF0215 family